MSFDDALSLVEKTHDLRTMGKCPDTVHAVKQYLLNRAPLELYQV